MRLQKYMALCGVASRRKSEELIRKGLVKVNGIIIKELGYKINVKKDKVEFNDKVIRPEEKKVYIMLNKPEGYVTSLKDPHNEKIVSDLIYDIEERIFPVGRLDAETTGLLLMTNDGDFAYKLTHPKYIIYKTYIALVEGIPNSKKLNKFRKGLRIEGKETAKAYIKILKTFNNKALLEIAIYEGRNRQVRKMCEYIRHPVISLKRIAIGDLIMKNLEIGEYRHLTEDEIKLFKDKWFWRNYDYS